MAKRLLLLDFQPLKNNDNFAIVWHNCMNEDLVLAPQGRHNGVLIVLNGNDTDALAEWIEEQDETFDNLPLFVIWDNRQYHAHSMCVHEYGPFENGIRQLVKEYKSQ